MANVSLFLVLLSLFVSMQAGWKKRHTIKLSKHHLLLVPFFPEFIPSSLSPSDFLFPPSLPPSISPLGILEMYKKKMFTPHLCSSIFIS